VQFVGTDYKSLKHSWSCFRRRVRRAIWTVYISGTLMKWFSKPIPGRIVKIGCRVLNV